MELIKNLAMTKAVEWIECIYFARIAKRVIFFQHLSMIVPVMSLPFCDHHIVAFLKNFETSSKPLDLSLSDYYRSHKSLGANDRRVIGETLFAMMRWKSLVDYFALSSHPKDRLAVFRKLDLEECQRNESIPEPIRYGVNDYLYSRFKEVFGLEKAREICRILNTSAPTTIRVNVLKTTREALFTTFEPQYPISRCVYAPSGIHFHKRTPLFSLPEFKQGLFEVQDEGSQLVAGLVDAKPGQHILDYCSGSGGKTLAFAPAMGGKGQIYLNDIRPQVLFEARKRLNRAGIQNFQWLTPKTPKGRMDWVLADVPCSGSGTLRRNLEAKWKIDRQMVDRLVAQQREIVKEALSYVKPGGRLVYATCSILPEENEQQVEFFLNNYSLRLEKAPLSLLPEEGGMDGFFGAVLVLTK
jgi:16S rRNA (cytosine967-C5)-methyltransferase